MDDEATVERINSPKKQGNTIKCLLKINGRMFKRLNQMRVVIKVRKTGFFSKTLDGWDTLLTSLKRKPEIDKVWSYSEDGKTH